MATTLVTVAHGTRHPTGVRTVEALVARVRYRLPDVTVRAAYVGIQRPSLGEVLADLRGPAVVVPLLLGVRPDPGPVEDHCVAEPLSPDRLLAEVMVLRLRQAGARPGQPVVLVAAGSPDPCAQGDTARAARMLEEIWRGPVRTAHLTGRGERVSEVVDGFDPGSASRHRPSRRTSSSRASSTPGPARTLARSGSARSPTCSATTRWSRRRSPAGSGPPWRTGSPCRLPSGRSPGPAGRRGRWRSRRLPRRGR
jgi:hypothetical protein